MKPFFLAIFSLIFTLNYPQTKKLVKKSPAKSAATKPSTKNLDLAKINDSVAELIPYKSDGKFGFKNQKGKIIIKPEYSNVGFFTNDCRLENSGNEKVKVFGKEIYASARLNDRDFRIDKSGKRAYEFRDSDLGKCPQSFSPQKFHAYLRQGFYGVVEDEFFKNENDSKSFRIYPQYQYLHIMEGKNPKNPMILAAQNDLFGIIDTNNKVVIPFEYLDIKPNFSWKLAHLFEVTKDGKNYFYIDENNRRY